MGNIFQTGIRVFGKATNKQQQKILRRIVFDTKLQLAHSENNQSYVKCNNNANVTFIAIAPNEW